MWKRGEAGPRCGMNYELVKCSRKSSKSLLIIGWAPDHTRFTGSTCCTERMKNF